MKKFFYIPFFLVLVFSSRLLAADHNTFTTGEGHKYLKENFNLNGWELSSAYTSWYPNDTTVVFDFVGGKSSYWYYIFRKSNLKNDTKVWSFLLTKIDNQFTAMDFGIEDDDFLPELDLLPQNYADSDLLPMVVQANSNLGVYLMSKMDKVKEFSVNLTPRFITEESSPQGMWMLVLDVEGETESAYCIFDAVTLEKFECAVPDVSSIDIDSTPSLLSYPNPTNGEVFFSITHDGYVFIKIFDVNGNIMRSEIANSNNGYSLNLSNLPSGTYTIVSLIEGKVYVNKIQVAK